MGNYREIVNLKNIEFCSEMRNPNSAGAKIFVMFQHTLQGVFHQCPYLIGPLRITNFTDSFMVEIDKLDKGDEKLTKEFHLGAFRGDMRVKIKFTTDEDPNVLDLMIAYTVKLRRAPSF